MFQELQSQLAEASSRIKNNVKSYKKEKEQIKSSYQSLEKQKLKYLKSFQDWEYSDNNYKAAEKDGNLARNEITRMKLESESKHAYYNQQTETYQNQLKKTNSEQSNYFCVLLPDLIDQLEAVERERLTFVMRVFHSCISSEKELQKIINKCRDDMETSVRQLEVERDIQLVLNINKSGEYKHKSVQCIVNTQLYQVSIVQVTSLQPIFPTLKLPN